jgi:hypothetical protein
MCYFFHSKGTAGPRTANTTFQIADVAQFEIQKQQRSGISSPGPVINHVFESVQGMHAFAGATSCFFIPTLAASFWLVSVDKLLSQLSHVLTVLYVCKIGLA